MRVLIAPDSMKGSLSAPAFCEAAARALAARFPQAEIVCLPLGDGGEGTSEALCMAAGGRMLETAAEGPYGTPVRASFALLPGGTAVAELASASGLTLPAPGGRDLFRADSGGTGTVLRAALDALWRDEGTERRLIVGLGGSATNDGGAGLLRALGARLLDSGGHPVPKGAEGLRTLHAIEPAGLDGRLRQTTLLAACDVTAPLCGEGGASAVFGPQKGASPADIPVLDGLLARFGAILARDVGPFDPDEPGTGAAGGAGAALRALGARIEPGFELIRRLLRLDERLRAAPPDLLITGEGRLDGQTALGKLPARMAALARAHRARTVAVVGACAPDWAGGGPFDRVISLCTGGVTPEYAMRHAVALLAHALSESEL